MGAKTNILYVDDEPDVRLIVALSLQLHPDVEARAAESAREALNILLVESWMPDLMLIDVTMPEISGPEMLERLRSDSRTAHVPVAFVTAKARPQEIQDYLSHGAIGVISKPFDALTFAEQALALLEKAKLAGAS